MRYAPPPLRHARRRAFANATSKPGDAVKRRIAIEFAIAAVLVLVGFVVVLLPLLNTIFGIVRAFHDVALLPSGTPAVVAAGPGLEQLVVVPLGLVAFGTGIGLASGAFLELRARRNRRRAAEVTSAPIDPI